MKKILLFVSILALSLNSCNKDDDDEANVPTVPTGIMGEWKYSKEGMIINGDEMMANYEHTPGCSADFIEFQSGSIMKDHYFEEAQNGCDESIDIGSWSQNGNILTASFDGETITAEIVTLNSTTLKVKYSFPGDDGIYLDEYVRQ
ncbi:MAG TPA: lipocalin family protein [Flavobacterium sp.]|jgi:hypothetical protein